MKQYVDEGKVQMVFKHFAFLGPESQWAAVASECAADQGKFWEYHDKLYNSQQGENQGAFNKDKLIAFGEELGLDAAAFAACVNDEATLARVQADTRGRSATRCAGHAQLLHQRPAPLRRAAVRAVPAGDRAGVG